MKIEFTQGVLAGSEFPLRGPSAVLGRGVEVDLQILDESVSRRHAQLAVAGDSVTITDLGSHNGTYVNGVRLRHSQLLQAGDQVVLGDSSFTLSEGEARPLAVSDDGPVQWAQPAGASPRGSRLPLVAAIAGVVVVLGAVALLVLKPWAGKAATPTALALVAPSGTAAKTAPAATASATTAVTATGAPTAAAATVAPSPAPVPTATPLVALALTPAPLALPSGTGIAIALPSGTGIAIALPSGTGIAIALPSGTGIAIALPSSTLRLPNTVVPTAVTLPPATQPTVPAPAFTVSWGPGTYDPWEGGHRLRSDLTITNVSLPLLTPPYAPAFVVAAADGSLRSGDLHDYSSPTNPLPALLPGESVKWTWYTIMPVTDRVVGSAFRYGDLTWTQQFNQDGSLAGAARPTSDQEMAPLIPTVLPSGMAPDQLATVLPGILPTIFPSGVPSGQ